MKYLLKANVLWNLEYVIVKNSWICNYVYILVFVLVSVRFFVNMRGFLRENLCYRFYYWNADFLVCLPISWLLLAIFSGMFQIKTFIMLINGLRNGIDLLNDLQRADHGILALYKIVDIPSLSYLPELIHKFEERMQNEFPCGQVKYAMVSHLL